MSEKGGLPTGTISPATHQDPHSVVSSPVDEDYPAASHKAVGPTVTFAPCEDTTGSGDRELGGGGQHRREEGVDTPENSRVRPARRLRTAFPQAGASDSGSGVGYGVTLGARYDERASDSAAISPDELAEDFDELDEHSPSSSDCVADDSSGSPSSSGGSVADVENDDSRQQQRGKEALSAGGYRGSDNGARSIATPSSTAMDTAVGTGSDRGASDCLLVKKATVAAPQPPPTAPITPTIACASPQSNAISTVGLMNEGCTCYLNSLLQLLFHIGYLRSAVYRIPADEPGDASVNSVYKALQELFFQMQERSSAARTKRLTDAFGWSEQDLFIQHDIQEMATILRDNLEEKMKGTVAEGSMDQLFEGRGEQFVETLDKTFTSRSADIFYDIHIPLSDHTSLLDSIASLTQRDRLVGDNKYKVEEEGKRPVYKEAEKSYRYVRFPPVAWFHLKRFAMDLTSPTLEMKKVNTRMEFPLVLDLRGLERGFTPEERATLRGAKDGRPTKASPFSDDSPAIYDLQGVIVHRGTVRSGHYYCYIRDWDPVARAFTRWIEFDDDNVRVVPEEVAVNANYGGPLGRGGCYNRDAPLSNANAYILSYVRRADAPVILGPSPTDTITQRLKDAMRKEMEEEERQSRLERAQRECVLLYVVTDESLAAYAEHHPAEFFPRDSRTAKNFVACVVEVPRSASVSAAYEAIAAEPVMALRGVTAMNCRLWRWKNTRGYRPVRPMATVEECQRADITMADYLIPAEADRPVAMCVYVQESMSVLRCVDPSQPLPLPSAADLQPLMKFEVDKGRGTCRVLFRGGTRVAGLALRLTASHATACKVQFILTTDRREFLPARVYRATITDDVVRVPLDPAVVCAALLLQCSTPSEALLVEDVHVELGPGDAPPPTAAIQAASKPTAPRLSSPGHDRVLLFLKWFDHVSCTVQYVGPALVDRSATLLSLEPLWFLLMGLPVPPHLYPRYSSASGERVALLRRPSTFAFFEEGRGAIVREVSPFVDLALAGLQDGAVVVAQSLDIPTVYRHVHVEAYYRTLLDTVDLRVLEVAQIRVDDGGEAYKRALAQHQQLAAQLLEAKVKRREDEAAAAAAAAAAMTSAQKLEDEITSQTAALPPSPVADRKPEVANVVADPSLDPFNTSLPLLHQRRLEVIGSDVARMPSAWLCETIYDALAVSTGTDPNYLRLYKNTSAEAPAPGELPVRCGGKRTLGDLLTTDGGTVSPVLFYERTCVPRAALERSFYLNLTLRDAAGHAVHAEAYVLPQRETMQGLVRSVRRSVQPWELQLDPWGTLRPTLDAPHYILLAVERRQRLIRHIVELPMVGLELPPGRMPASPPTLVTQLETRLDPALMGYDIVLMPAAPLRPGEHRIACCHGDYRMADAVIFGHPFVITIGEETTVTDARRLMTEATHVPIEALSAQRNTGKDYGVMMYTDVPLHFADWSEYVTRFWQHTHNASGFIPSMMLNHPRPREKPGSRYVVQPSPQLKIAKN